MRTNILVVGVGGQGVILLSTIIGRALTLAGLDVVIGETKGLARRGGSVEAHIKVGDSYTSPLIPKGLADAVLALELLEGLRYIPWLKRGGCAVISVERVPPINTFLYDEEKYPSIDDAVMTLRSLAKKYNYKVYLVNPLKYAIKVGNPLTSNVVMLGFLSRILNLNIKEEYMVEAIKSSVPSKTIDDNIKAYKMGVEYANNALTKNRQEDIIIDT